MCDEAVPGKSPPPVRETVERPPPEAEATGSKDTPAFHELTNPQPVPTPEEVADAERRRGIEHGTVKELARCSGHCCESFPLGLDGENPHQMQHYLRHSHPHANGRPFEGLQIADMIRPLLGKQNVYGQQLYTCRHFNRETRNCGIYETRPAMCSDFPYGKPCTVPGCTRLVEIVVPPGPKEGEPVKAAEGEPTDGKTVAGLPGCTTDRAAL